MGYFSAVYRHPGGTGKHYLGYLLILPTPNVVNYTATGSCLIEYNRLGGGSGQGGMRLIDNAGTGWLGPIYGLPVGSGGGTLSNNQCSVNTSNVVASFSGTDMTITTPVSFTSSFTGPLATFLQEEDVDGQWTGMTQFANWNATPITSPKPGPYIRSLTSPYYEIAPTTVEVTTGHTSGLGSMGNVNILIADQIVGGSTRCHIIYSRAAQRFWLVNAAGTALIDVPGNNGTCQIGSPSATPISSTDVSLYIPVQWLVAPPTRLSTWANTFDSSNTQTTHWIASPGGISTSPGGQTQMSTTGRTDVYYDAQTNKVYQVSSGSFDYSTDYYYSLRINTFLRKNGLTVGGGLAETIGSSYASVYAETPAETGQVFDVVSWFDLKVEHQVYEFVPGCYSCYDWYDPFNYSWVSTKGEPIDTGITFGAWVWASPTVVISKTISDIISLGNTGGRATVPGPKNVFDLKVRAFIPVSWLWGPDTCIPHSPFAANVPTSTIYRGDDRSYNPWEYSAYRGMSQIFLSSAGSILPPGHYRNTGRTKRFASNALQPDGQTLKEDTVFHDCYLLDDVGFGPINNINVSVSGSAPSVSANFYGGLSNPVSIPFVTPDINYNHTVTINTTNPITPSYTVNYTHDCYPAHEVFHGGQLLYGFMPAGHAAWANLAPCLYGFGQIVGSTAGTLF